MVSVIVEAFYICYDRYIAKLLLILTFYGQFLRWFKFKLKFDIQFEGPPVGMYDVPGAGRQETW